MNLPVSVHDLSLLGHAPLRDYIAVHKSVKGQRSAAKLSVSRFVKEMRQNSKAAAAAKEWARLLFGDVLEDGSSLEATDGGEELYKVFLEYQYRLHQGREDGDFGNAYQYQAHIVRNGISIIKAVELRDHATKTGLCAQRRDNEGGSKGEDKQRASRPSGPKKACRQVGLGILHRDAEDHATRSSLRHGSHSATGRPAIQEEPALGSPSVSGTRRFSVPERAKPSNRSIFKKDKKRKASSQKPPVITPSDASEDDKELPKTVPAASSISHRPKRIASNPSCQAHDLFEVTDRVDATNSAHRAETNPDRRSATSIPQHQSPLTSFTSDDFVSHSSIKGRRGAGFPLSGRKRGRAGFSDVSTHPLRPRGDSRRLQKIKSAKEPQPHPNKRMRRASGSTLDGEAGERFGSVHDLQVESFQQPTIKEPLVTDSPLTRENTESKAQRKRTLHEFETAFVASDENVSADCHEFIGPDVRSLRPLPRKVHTTRLWPAVRGVPCGASSLEHTDQLIRDVASNALAIIREGVESNISDWTQDKEHDAECDELQGDDQDEATNFQDTTTISAPPKPPLPVPPRIWAQSRQEVCESFEYFRCYHGGVYSKDDIVKGYLLGAYSASRDVFHHDGKLIISHGGGKSESILDSRRRPKRYQTDQDQEASDKSVRALLKTCKDRRPIALLADDKYALFPYDLASANYTYIVLGLYWISHAWAECQSTRDGSGRIVRWKFAFQWCEGQGDPWWSPQQDMTDTTSYPPKSISMCPANDPSNPPDTGRDPGIQCENCQEHSPFVYKEGWMCLNPRCDLFWSINGEEPKQLDYREEFLDLIPQEFERLPNITPVKVVKTTDGIATTYAFSKGLHCTTCGRLSCRYKWEYWECSNCNLKHVVDGRLRLPKEFWHQRPSKGFLHSQIGKDSGILACRLEPINLGVRKGFTNRLTFILPHARGKIHLILGTPLSNGDADGIFQLYQQQASTGELKLRRYPLRTHRARGPLLTNYFSQNSGEPYQYVGGSGQTVPFREAPDCVQRALALIKERASLALGTDIPFNEILSAAYMERQKMSFHSDSEKGLGPIVASLSLGSAALMHFRPHVSVENPTARSGHALTLVLRHGDVLIMDGDGVQKDYEHTVVPMNFRIAATARCIGSV